MVNSTVFNEYSSLSKKSDSKQSLHRELLQVHVPQFQRTAAEKLVQLPIVMFDSEIYLQVQEEIVFQWEIHYSDTFIHANICPDP